MCYTIISRLQPSLPFFLIPWGSSRPLRPEDVGLEAETGSLGAVKWPLVSGFGTGHQSEPLVVWGDGNCLLLRVLGQRPLQGWQHRRLRW
jgi:hypothetical protein